MISLQQITIRRSQKVLLEDVSLTIYAKQRIGLIGDNGCGKTTFFAMLQGEVEPHQGTLALPNIEIAQVKQEIPSSKQPAIEYVMDGDRQLRSLQEKISEAEESGNAHLLANYHDELAAIDGYAIIGKAEKILRGLGFKSSELYNATREFSGGWRMRLNLAQALISRSDLMLLDEPTNHLDLDSIIWLEKWLQDYPGTLLIISHDREFLDNTVSSILHFENQQLKLYRGNYSAFEKQQADQLAVQQASYEKQQAKINHLQAFVDRFRAKATKAKQAQSRLKALEKIERIAAVQSRSSLQFSFKKPEACPNPLLRIEKAAIGYSDENPILTNIDLSLVPADRIGLLGVNGAGKSTFIKLLAGLLPPHCGEIHFYKGIKIGYFAQHQIEHLNLEYTPLQSLQEIAPTKSDQELRNYLGSFNFSGDMSLTPIVNFSGGEKARLALALIIWQAPNLLLLDEPTNHLDLTMREALILALQEYSGALILVSHDRHLVRTTTDELMIVADGTISRFKGDLEDYRQYLLARKPTSVTEKKVTIDSNKEKRKLASDLNRLEKQLSKLQQQKQELDLLLSDPTLYEQQETDRIRDYQKQQQELSDQIELIEANWLSLSEKYESYNT